MNNTIDSMQKYNLKISKKEMREDKKWLDFKLNLLRNK